MYFNVIVFPFRQSSINLGKAKFIQLQSCPGVHKVRVGPATWTAVCSWFIQLIYFTVHTIHYIVSYRSLHSAVLTWLSSVLDNYKFIVSHFYFQQEMSYQQNAGLPGSPTRHTILVHKTNNC